LRKCTYLSNDSSYSVSAEDGVDISLSDNIACGSDKEGLEQHHGSTMQESDFNMTSSGTATRSSNFTLEAQVK